MPRSAENKQDQMRFRTAEELKYSKWKYIMILSAAFTINFTACGLLFGFGVYQELYETLAKKETTPFTGASTAEIDLIGTLSVSMMTIGAPFAVAWAKQLSPQMVVCAGGLIFGLACIFASFGTALWHFQLSQGLLLGIGTCLSFMPSMTVAPTWFDKNRGLAMGIVSAGTGIGGLVWAPAISAGISHLGFRNTLRLTGTIATVLICASGICLSWAPPIRAEIHSENTKRSLLHGLLTIPIPPAKLVRQRKFAALAFSAAFQSAAYYTPVFFTVAYAKTLGYSVTNGANLTAASNACNAVGKIAVGFAADRIGRLNSFFLTTLLSAAMCLGLWLPSTTIGAADYDMVRGLFVTFVVLYGLFASAFISLFPTALVELFGMMELPRVAGVMYMMQGLAALAGTPIAGILVTGHGTNQEPSSYTGMAAFVGALMTAATVTVAWVRIERTIDSEPARKRRQWKL